MFNTKIRLLVKTAKSLNQLPFPACSHYLIKENVSIDQVECFRESYKAQVPIATAFVPSQQLWIDYPMSYARLKSPVVVVYFTKRFIYKT